MAASSSSVSVTPSGGGVHLKCVILHGVVLGLLLDYAADGGVLVVDVGHGEVRNGAEGAGVLGVAVVEPVEILAPGYGGAVHGHYRGVEVIGGAGAVPVEAHGLAGGLGAGLGGGGGVRFAGAAAAGEHREYERGAKCDRY